MSGTGTLVSITECVAYFAEKPRELDVDRTTISRCVKKHGLSRGTAGRKTLVDPAEVFEVYTNDFQRKVMSGEESGLRQRTPQSAAPAQRTPVAPAPEDDSAPLPGPGTKVRTAAEDEKAEKVRALRRTNAEAEAMLIPTSEVAAAMASAVAEQRTVWTRRLREFIEKQASALDLDTAQALSLKAAVKEFLAAGQNAFAAELRELLEARESDTMAVAVDFEALVQLADDQAARRRKDSQPHAA